MFKRKTPKPPLPDPIIPLRKERTDYPYGSCVKTEAGWFLIREKTRFRIGSERILWSWKFDPVKTTEAAVKHFTIAGRLGFRDGTLINNVASGKMYVVSQNKKRHIVSPDVFDKYGYDMANMMYVSDAEANLHTDGEVLS